MKNCYSPTKITLFRNESKPQVAVFTTEYILRFYAVVEETDSSGRHPYSGLAGRLRWAVTDFYSWVDLASIVPYYLDLAVAQDLPATQFIRYVFRCVPSCSLCLGFQYLLVKGIAYKRRVEANDVYRYSQFFTKIATVLDSVLLNTALRNGLSCPGIKSV